MLGWREAMGQMRRLVWTTLESSNGYLRDHDGLDQVDDTIWEKR